MLRGAEWAAAVRIQTQTGAGAVGHRASWTPVQLIRSCSSDGSVLLETV